MSEAKQPPRRTGGRAGRRETPRPHLDDRPALERFRTPILAVVAIVAVVGVGAVVFSSATAAAYTCSSVDTVQAPQAETLGQVQPDMGAAHVATGDRVTYAVCPPASGKHANRVGFGPLEPKIYGPEDRSLPSGWIHNLEHGALVLLYSCDRGACDEGALAALKDVTARFPASPVCGTPAGVIGPVIARFEQMPTTYAAILWNRVLYLDELDADRIFEFFLRYGEVVTEDGAFIAPPEQQCAAPSPSAPAG